PPPLSSPLFPYTTLFRSCFSPSSSRCPLSNLSPRYRLEPGLSAGSERPQVAVPGEADHLHLPGAARARPLGDAPRADVSGMNDRDRKSTRLNSSHRTISY